MRTYIYTFGCKVNQVESEKIVNELKFYNLQHVSDISDADLVIFNTCAVTEKAENKFRSVIKKLKSDNPAVKIAVTGCAAEKDKEKLKNIGADIVVTNSGKMDILRHIAENSDYLTGVFETHGFADAQNISMAARTRAFVKIQDGCDSNCAYCIIPSLRGLPVSRNSDSVMSEVQALVNAGYKEIVPVGIHVGKYGLDTGSSLMELIRGIVSLEGDFRVRLTSIEPNELTDEMIAFLAENTHRICRHYHIPLQSGCTDTLRAMNRNYTADEYTDKLQKLKKAVPDCMLGADVIVGFPGETDGHFEQTIKTIRLSGLEHLHVFSYSDRSGTRASDMPDKVSLKIKSERAKHLRKLAAEIKYNAARRQIGKTYKVLTQKDNEGLTDNYFTVKFKSDVEPNLFLDVLIADADNDGNLEGVINV
jgi:threonylcarbamoyladenosine tRNA methylthiotransferase MtaB